MVSSRRRRLRQWPQRNVRNRESPPVTGPDISQERCRSRLVIQLENAQSLNDFSVVVQDTNTNVLAVNIESSVKCKSSPERRDRETGTNNTFHDTRSTEASFIVSLCFGRSASPCRGRRQPDPTARAGPAVLSSVQRRRSWRSRECRRTRRPPHPR